MRSCSNRQYIYTYASRCKRTSSCLVSRRTVREIEEKQARGDAFQDLATPCSHNIATTRTIKCLGSGHRRDIKSGGGKIPSFPPLALGKNLFLFLFFFPPFLSLSFLTFTACYLTVARAFVYSCLNLYTWYYSYTGWQASRFMFNASVNVSFRGNALRIHPITWLVVTKRSWHWWLLPCFHIIVQLCIFILYQLWIYDFSFKGVVNNRWAFISVSGIFSG